MLPCFTVSINFIKIVANLLSFPLISDFVGGNIDNYSLTYATEAVVINYTPTFCALMFL